MKLLVAFIFAVFLAGCSSSFSEVKQLDDKAYLQLTGNIASGSLSIDGKQISLQQADKFKIDGNLVTKFEISSGTHLIEIVRNDKTVVKRKIYVTNGNVFEVNVP
ncbi:MULTISPECIES: hypothetical protein [Alteromonadaceae]|uniref:hypothetical protein n=1 Tax=Alteromonadaceae TaxID=72275 RepID=UPI001C08794E|nr:MULTISPECIES: hypothetical protein [Aliiglaciecola]MBU2876954.1 hypothetical protein [Aliiglaciecola lipolytica]MDO6712644.1 hypothetical protein [Aliiglaciecola sp. 2_MG-2023]MDO6753748.1 hypothetical protein [Aliiglaciecola sp. 1_MG-2023]